MRLRFVDIGPTSSAKNEKIYTFLFFGKFYVKSPKLSVRNCRGVGAAL